jgi:cytidylate kinase
MNLILLYGPPAVGKLTIAKEIARLTGFKVFHNQLTVNLAAAIFPRGTPAYRHWEPQSTFEAASQWDSLSLNTDVLRPVEAAQQVITHYRLPTAQHNLTTQEGV